MTHACNAAGCPQPGTFLTGGKHNRARWCCFHFGVHPEDLQRVTMVLQQNAGADPVQLGGMVRDALRKRVESRRAA